MDDKRRKPDESEHYNPRHNGERGFVHEGDWIAVDEYTLDDLMDQNDTDVQAARDEEEEEDAR